MESEKHCLAKLVPVGSSSAELILVTAPTFVVVSQNEHAFRPSSSTAYTVTGLVASTSGPDLFSLVHKASPSDIFTIVKQSPSITLTHSNPAEPERFIEVDSEDGSLLLHGCLIQLTFGDFIARWRYVREPQVDAKTLTGAPSRVTAPPKFILDDHVINFIGNAPSLSSSIFSSTTSLDDGMAPPPTKKRKRDKQGEVIVHNLDDVPRDPVTGEPKMPLALTGGVTILSLGQIDSASEKFHNNRYIFPVGFRSRRQYSSLVDPSRRCSYLQEIRSASTKSKVGLEIQEPSFTLICEESPDQVMSSNTPSGVWAILREKTKAHREEKAGKKLSTNISGQEQFGLSNPIVKALIEALPDAKQCKRYWDAPAKQDAVNQMEET